MEQKPLGITHNYGVDEVLMLLFIEIVVIFGVSW